jgi:hypothetical protein
MTLAVRLHGLDVPQQIRDQLIEDDVAARLVAGDPTLWGPAAEREAAIRLGWLDLPATSRELVSPLAELQAPLAGEGTARPSPTGSGRCCT